ncbi:hypothetical protein JAAARDRAFT_128904 [Jaapia argillacea MUCL 33604]|uniref:Major facilitator superfamily (MFS) profile domain-containing protein n=1 Tax=Jaapia argillacea MUCL 33604 TaxID=933084 RepID=A0A067Q5G1_9AGAM|nr:hypothetical protein JAAARDRAFT_128904 [Jaapia argillacea MUCL 33604]
MLEWLPSLHPSGTSSSSSTIVAHELERRGDSLPRLPSSNDLQTSSVSPGPKPDPLELSRAITITLDLGDDPKNFSTFRKWLIVVVVSSSAMCVTCGSGIAPFTEKGIQQDFHISPIVSILSISLFSEGLAVGPLFLGPISEFVGRNAVYHVSFLAFALFTLPVAFAPNAAVHFIFRFLCGFAGSAFLTVAGGTVSDLFADEGLSNPMAVYTICPFIGPVIGPAISGVINQHLQWRWTYHVQFIWEFVQLLALLLFVPETYMLTILKRKAKRLRNETNDHTIQAPADSDNASILAAIFHSCWRPFHLLISEPMVLLLNLWDSLVLGILYLTFQAFPIIFETGHGYNMQSTGFTFLAFGFGMLLALASQPFWNWIYSRHHTQYEGKPPPETRLVMGQVGGVLVPVSLLIMALTASPHVSPILPIAASIPFGAGIVFIFTSTFTYLVASYRPLAASILASNAFMRLTFASAFPLFAGQMFRTLGSEGALGLLAGLTALATPLPFVFAKIGERLRMQSKFAVQ